MGGLIREQVDGDATLMKKKKDLAEIQGPVS
jgi:hypothetical protein